MGVCFPNKNNFNREEEIKKKVVCDFNMKRQIKTPRPTLDVFDLICSDIIRVYLAILGHVLM